MLSEGKDPVQPCSQLGHPEIRARIPGRHPGQREHNHMMVKQTLAVTAAQPLLLTFTTHTAHSLPATASQAKIKEDILHGIRFQRTLKQQAIDKQGVISHYIKAKVCPEELAGGKLNK